MKKSAWIWAVVVCWILCVMPAKADAIWEPNDTFYHDHYEDCRYVNRNFTANGPDGEVIVYKSPENPTVVATWENGFHAYISFVYTDEDGNEWGIYEDFETGVKGWMPMAYMQVIYDGISFTEEYGESFVEDSAAFPAEYAGQTVYCFTYPGSESCFEMRMPEVEEEMPWYARTFTDEQGMVWGYIGYFRGVRDRWVCITNATATFEELYPDGAPVRGEKPEETPMPEEDAEEESKSADREEDGDDERIAPERDGGLIGLVIALVVAVTSATGGALAWWKKRK